MERARMRWSVVIPYFNEATGIEPTLRSLGRQTEPFQLILVDNGSTDGSEGVCRRVMAEFPHVAVRFLREPRPGQVHALKRGASTVRSEFVAICDADTWYPAHYLARATTLYDAGGPKRVSVNAYLRRGGAAGSLGDRFNSWHWLTAARVWPQQNHTSGAGQTFRTAAFHMAGGYDPAIWPYVLKDHELMARVLRVGSQTYDADLWCVSSDRRADRSGVRWTFAERLRYHFYPARDKRHFFHGWLKPRFEARGQLDTKLRERAWEGCARSGVTGAAVAIPPLSAGITRDQPPRPARSCPR